ncbi:MAG: Holliday junction branch migration protein RuvA [Ignavibacteria bacterium]|jgi:Holliday junction DNA helicase RuvA
MLEYIKGKLISKKPTSIIIESGGTAFNINITLPAYETLPQINDEVKIITHFHVKENPISFVLYGFSDEGERECFRQIISISGIGPKTAMSILSALGYKEIIELINKGNYLPLTSISGVGKKTAERLGLELKDKFAKSEMETAYSGFDKQQFGELSKVSAIISGLITLGYNRIEADKMVKKFATSPDFEKMPVEEVIKEILRGK